MLIKMFRSGTGALKSDPEPLYAISVMVTQASSPLVGPEFLGLTEALLA